MIYTNEAIQDPVEFIQANADEFGHRDWATFSGVDFDVLATLQTDKTRSQRIGTYYEMLSPVFGWHYFTGQSFGIELGDRTADVFWAPSPIAINGLVRRLGYEPGVDKLAFTHVPQRGTVPASDYHDHLAAGEYPISTREDHFVHDRDDDHALGVLLLPPFVTKNIIESARKRADSKRRKITTSGSVVREFDGGTSTISRYSTELYPFARDDRIEDFNEKDIESYFWYSTLLQHFNEKEDHKIPRAEKVKRTAAFKLIAHMQELIARVAELDDASLPFETPVDV